MALFTSDREKRFWFYTLVLLAGIYSTLGLVRPMADTLRENGLLSTFFLIGMVLVGCTILAFAIRDKHSKTTWAVILGILAVYLMVFVRMEIPEERTHIIEYGVVALFIHQALIERSIRKGSIKTYTLLAILLASLAGAIDEFIQIFLPNRVFDCRDVLFNTLAGAMAIGSGLAFRWARSRVGNKKTPT